MNLFLFGAGASYGSDLNKAILPPVASDLFKRLAQYPDISNNLLTMSLASEFTADFEQGLLKLYEKQPQFWSILQRCMAHFFFQYGTNIPIGYSNLYYLLAQEVKKRNSSIALATLNYERIIAPMMGLRVRSPSHRHCPI